MIRIRDLIAVQSGLTSHSGQVAEVDAGSLRTLEKEAREVSDRVAQLAGIQSAWDAGDHGVSRMGT